MTRKTTKPKDDPEPLAAPREIWRGTCDDVPDGASVRVIALRSGFPQVEMLLGEDAMGIETWVDVFDYPSEDRDFDDGARTAVVMQAHGFAIRKLLTSGPATRSAP